MNNIFVILLIVAIILLICFAAMAIKIWAGKDGKFIETEIGRNENMQKLGIKCAKQEEMELLSKLYNKKPDCSNCDGCFLKEIKTNK